MVEDLRGALRSEPLVKSLVADRLLSRPISKIYCETSFVHQQNNKRMAGIDVINGKDCRVTWRTNGTGDHPGRPVTSCENAPIREHSISGQKLFTMGATSSNRSKQPCNGTTRKRTDKVTVSINKQLQHLKCKYCSKLDCDCKNTEIKLNHNKILKRLLSIKQQYLKDNIDIYWSTGYKIIRDPHILAKMIIHNEIQHYELVIPLKGGMIEEKEDVAGQDKKLYCWHCKGNHRLSNCKSVSSQEKKALYSKYKDSKKKNDRSKGSKMSKQVDELRNHYQSTTVEPESKVKMEGKASTVVHEDNREVEQDTTPWVFKYPSSTKVVYRKFIFPEKEAIYSTETIPTFIMQQLNKKITIIKSRMTWIAYENYIVSNETIIKWLYENSDSYDERYIKLRRFYYSNTHLITESLAPAENIPEVVIKERNLAKTMETVNKYGLKEMMKIIFFYYLVLVSSSIIGGIFWHYAIGYLNIFWLITEILIFPFTILFWLFVPTFGVQAKVYDNGSIWGAALLFFVNFIYTAPLMAVNALKDKINFLHMMYRVYKFFQIHEITMDNLEFLNVIIDDSSHYDWVLWGVKNRFIIEEFLRSSARFAVIFIIFLWGILVLYYLFRYFYRSILPVRQYCMIETFPNFSLYIEEIIKCIPGGWRFVGYLEYIKYNTWKNYYWHRRSMRFSFFIRVDLHKKSNTVLNNHLPLYNEYVCSLTKPTQQFTQGKEVCVIPLPPQTLPNVPQHINTTYGTLRNPEKKLDYNSYSGITPLLFNISTFQKPADSLDNRMASYHNRYIMDNKLPVWGAVTAMQDILTLLYNEIGVMVIEYDEWYQTLKMRQKQAIERDLKLYNLGKKFDKVEMSSKSDELLCNFPLDMPEKKMYNRGLFNLTGYWLHMLGPWVEAATKDLKQFDGTKHIEYKGIFYYPFFTCGATSKELENFYDIAYHNTDKHNIYFMVMGDDNAEKSLENDFSKFDRTQSFILMEALGQVWKSAGYDSHIIDEWLRLCTLPVINIHKKTNTKLVTGNFIEGKYTGEPTTCLSNSLLNIASTIYAHSMSGVQTLEQGFIEFGFEPKTASPKYITFLKGTFLKNIIGTHTWTRLPSFLGKFGKVLKEMDNVVPTHMKQQSIGKKAAFALWSMWLGYGKMDNNSFYYQVHSQIKRICKNYLDILPSESIKQDWHIESTSSIEVSDEVFYDFIYYRYGLPKDELDDFCNFLSTIQELPTIYHHPLIQKFMNIDY